MHPKPATDLSFEQRAAGAFVGALVGDALGLGPHWYYDLEEQVRDYGEWIDDYTDPQPERYHAGSKAGDSSQQGILMLLMAHSLIDCDGYDEADFCRRLDEELFPKLDGTPVSGPGGYTSQSIRDAWNARVRDGRSWGDVAGRADNTEALERVLPLAIRYARQPRRMAKAVVSNTALTQSDDIVQSMTVAFCAVLAQLLQGRRLDADISGTLMRQVKAGDLPFHTIVRDDLQPPQPGDIEASLDGVFASPDALLSPGYMACAAHDPGVTIEPASKVSIVYGMPCAIYHQLPAAYYLAARFEQDFESAVLHAINGGGQNMTRAMLTGALVGASVGIDKIPERFINGLNRREEILELAQRISGGG
jgi:ADP-ribosylglycohydrolase